MDKLVFATNNPGKMDEISKFGASNNIELLSLADAGITDLDPEETGASFKENADIKLKATLDRLSDISVWVAGDDSGIMIDALNGEPGVRSRRWNGTIMEDQEIVDYALERLKGVPYEKRGASFKATVSLAHSSNPSSIQTFEGELRGKILQSPDTRQNLVGLPFRQLFFIPEISRMLGDTKDLPPEMAGLFLSHRERAFKKVFSYIKDISSIN